jgi:hypothetical protein
MNAIEIPFLMVTGILWQKEGSDERAAISLKKPLTGGQED